jgi:cysteine-rich repeat protein
MKQKNRSLALFYASAMFVSGFGIAFFFVQAEVAIAPVPKLTFELTKRVVYGYHKGDSTDHCGNGTVESAQNETCDGTGVIATCRERNTTGSTACTNECCTYCGDGNLNDDGGGESCDDGNTTAGDGCSGTCTIESGYSCTGGQPSVCKISCGDGVIGGSEACDDGGESATCDDDCTAVACGDGNTNETAGEECDDANSSNADECSTACKNSYCGDAIVQESLGEACEPSLNTSCGTNCQIQLSIGNTQKRSDYEITYSLEDLRHRDGPCGNAIVEPERGEECDTGRFNGVTPCSVDCTYLFCGDGNISAHLAEECEVTLEEEVVDGETRYWYTTPNCGLSCTLPSCIGGSCTGGCERDFLPPCENGVVTYRSVRAPSPVQEVVESRPTDRPPPPEHCGNGVHEPLKGEQCDLGSLNAVAGCSLWCEILHCGDSVVSAHIGEECEPKKAEDGSFIVNECGTICTIPICDEKGSCTGGCKLDFSISCTTPDTNIDFVLDDDLFEEDLQTIAVPIVPTLDTSPVCGNARIEEEEECDDGNTYGDDGCSSDCLLERGSKALCGDGITQEWEECDNGALNSDTAPNTCRTTCRLSYCGDSIEDANEQCDDGNTIEGDGCSALCFIADCGNGVLEIGEGCDDGKYNSDELPNTCRTNCVSPYCGDSVIDTALGEKCDDGDQNSDTLPDSCRTYCWPSECGDGVQDEGEECDDGNNVHSDFCSNDCMYPRCGNGIRQANEECDDGNTANGDGCDSLCRKDIRVDNSLLLIIMLIFGMSALTEWWIRKRLMTL